MHYPTQKIATLLFSLSLFCLPITAIAACTDNGSTVVYVNGIFTPLSKAKEDLNKLEREYRSKSNNHDTVFLNGYNPSHVAGYGDLAQSVAQIFGTTISNYDLNTILLQIYPEVETRKLLLVGHSQGSFYANLMYDYLISHGEPREALGVYHVASPANFVAGGGSYVTSSSDSVINDVRDKAKLWSAPQPLPANIDLPVGDDNGHSLSSNYLAHAPERIVGDLQKSISNLTPTLASNTGDCFTPPQKTLNYQAEKVLFSIADPTALALKRTGQVTVAALGKIVTDLNAMVEEVNTATLVVTDEVGVTNEVVKELPGLVLSAQTEEPSEILTPQIIYVSESSRSAPADNEDSNEKIEDPVAEEPNDVPTDTPTLIVETATTTNEAIVEEAPVPLLFSATTTVPVIVPQGCTVSLFRDDVYDCRSAETTFIWDAVPGASYYEFWSDFQTIEATTTQTSITISFFTDVNFDNHSVFIKAYDSVGTDLQSEKIKIYHNVDRPGWPRITSVTPSYAETGVATNTPLVLVFDTEEFPTGFISFSYINLVGVDSWVETTNLSRTATSTTVYVYTGTPLACNSRYYFFVRGVLNSSNSGFTTVACE